MNPEAILTPEDVERFKPEFEAIVWHLHVVLDADLNKGLSEEDIAGHALEGLRLMEILMAKIHEKQDGRSVQEVLKRAAEMVKPAERAGVAGGLIAAITSLSATGLGGFGVAAGGTAVGVSGLAGATVATGGAALAGGAALYLAYRGGAAALSTDAGKTSREKLGRWLSGLGTSIEGDER